MTLYLLVESRSFVRCYAVSVAVMRDLLSCFEVLPPPWIREIVFMVEKAELSANTKCGNHLARMFNILGEAWACVGWDVYFDWLPTIWPQISTTTLIDAYRTAYIVEYILYDRSRLRRIMRRCRFDVVSMFPHEPGRDIGQWNGAPWLLQTPLIRYQIRCQHQSPPTSPFAFNSTQLDVTNDGFGYFVVFSKCLPQCKDLIEI